jgi:hypothetical protein
MSKRNKYVKLQNGDENSRDGETESASTDAKNENS